MVLKLAFILCIKDVNQRNAIAASIKQLNFQLELKSMSGDDLLVQTEVPSDNSERTAYVCKGLCEMRGVDHVTIFIDEIADPIPTPVQENIAVLLLPIIPMVASSLVTFLVIFTAVDQLATHFSAHPESRLEALDILKLAGIPAFITFLTHITFEWRKLVTIIQKFQRFKKTTK